VKRSTELVGWRGEQARVTDEQKALKQESEHGGSLLGPELGILAKERVADLLNRHEDEPHHEGPYINVE
jgi:hypothetical protein